MMFNHPATIPIPFALAVFDAQHEKATADTWDIFDRYTRKQAITWVREILEANEWEVQKNLDWWKKELTYPDN